MLNENELKVLLACATDTCEFDGKYFMSENVKVEGLTAKQIQGYLSQLVQKRYIYTQEDCYYSAVFDDLGFEVLDNNNIWRDPYS